MRRRDFHQVYADESSHSDFLAFVKDCPQVRPQEQVDDDDLPPAGFHYEPVRAGFFTYPDLLSYPDFSRAMILKGLVHNDLLQRKQ
jgi:hypothetical protein